MNAPAMHRPSRPSTLPSIAPTGWPTRTLILLMVGSGLLSGLIPAAGCGHQRAPATATPDIEGNRRLALRYFEEMWNRLDPAVAAEIVAPDVVGHINSVTVRGLDKLRERIGTIARMYAPTHFTVESVVAEGDKIVVRWIQHATHTGAYFGPSSTGKHVTVTGMNMFRIAAGRIAEIWVNADDLGELEQIGLVKLPGGA